MKCTKRLSADHEVIRQALHVLQAVSNDVQNAASVADGDIQSLLNFLREFADGSHHVKEQAILFPALMHAGMPLDGGLLHAMNYEHERGRTLTAAMQDALNRNRMDDFVTCADRYIELLANHIEKEETVLFAAADETLSDEEDERITADFEHFDAVIFGLQTRQRLHQTIQLLASKYLSYTGARC
jgi:regulator of cell morphogenesis and NO signaling